MRFLCFYEDCIKTFNRRSALRDHLIFVHDYIHSDLNCQLCDETFTCAKQLSAHEKKEHGDFNCEICGQKFSKKSYLNLHGQVHLDKRDEYECHICRKKYLYKSNLKAHIRNKHENLNFNCIFCHQQFSTKQKLEEHIKNKHKYDVTEIEIRLSDIHESEEEEEKENETENKAKQTESISDLSNDLSNLDSFEFDANDFCLLDLDISI